MTKTHFRLAKPARSRSSTSASEGNVPHSSLFNQGCTKVLETQRNRCSVCVRFGIICRHGLLGQRLTPKRGDSCPRCRKLSVDLAAACVPLMGRYRRRGYRGDEASPSPSPSSTGAASSPSSRSPMSGTSASYDAHASTDSDASGSHSSPMERERSTEASTSDSDSDSGAEAARAFARQRAAPLTPSSVSESTPTAEDSERLNRRLPAVLLHADSPPPSHLRTTPKRPQRAASALSKTGEEKRLPRTTYFSSPSPSPPASPSRSLSASPLRSSPSSMAVSRSSRTQYPSTTSRSPTHSDSDGHISHQVKQTVSSLAPAMAETIAEHATRPHFTLDAIENALGGDGSSSDDEAAEELAASPTTTGSTTTTVGKPEPTTTRKSPRSPTKTKEFAAPSPSPPVTRKKQTSNRGTRNTAPKKSSATTTATPLRRSARLRSASVAEKPQANVPLPPTRLSTRVSTRSSTAGTSSGRPRRSDRLKKGQKAPSAGTAGVASRTRSRSKRSTKARGK